VRRPFPWSGRATLYRRKPPRRTSKPLRDPAHGLTAGRNSDVWTAGAELRENSLEILNT
jgi:hypothetical protein